MFFPKKHQIPFVSEEGKHKPPLIATRKDLGNRMQRHPITPFNEQQQPHKENTWIPFGGSSSREKGGLNEGNFGQVGGIVIRKERFCIMEDLPLWEDKKDGSSRKRNSLRNSPAPPATERQSP